MGCKVSLFANKSTVQTVFYLHDNKYYIKTPQFSYFLRQIPRWPAVFSYERPVMDVWMSNHMQQWHCLSLGMAKEFHPISFYGCNYLSILGIMLIRVSKRGEILCLCFQLKKQLLPLWSLQHPDKAVVKSVNTLGGINAKWQMLPNIWVHANNKIAENSSDKNK